MLVYKADVSNDDAPTFGETNPSLRLAPDLTGRSRAVEKGRCHCKVATKGGDHGPRQASGKAGGRTRRPERCDFLIAVQILRLTVAHRARIIAEYLIERRNVVADQRPLVSFKGCSNFCNHIRNIDLQFVAPKAKRCGFHFDLTTILSIRMRPSIGGARA
jgi:hypothetical protein